MKIKAYLQSSSFRFALLSMILIWAALTIVMVSMYFYARANMIRVLEWQMNTDEESVIFAIQNQPDEHLTDILLGIRIQPNTQIRLNNVLIQDAHRASEKKDRQDNQEDRVRTSGDLVISRKIVTDTNQTIVLYQRIGWFKEIYRDMIEAIVLGVSVTLVLAIAISLFLAHKSMSRIQKMANACQTIMNGDLSHRLPLSQSGPIDDYDKISVNVNLMLDRIQKLMTQVQQVSDNIAHDLRSPLTHVQTRLEQFLNTHDSEEIESALCDIDRILDMFNALLSIAKLEAKQLHQPEEIEISRVLMDACEMYRPMFEKKGIKLQFNIGDGWLKADKNLLFQAFLNLLDNALKFTPERGVVSVGAHVTKDRFEINITDSGPGIDEGKFEQVFERFNRLDNARTLPGFGLGLSQVKAIIQLHRGSVTLVNNDGLSVRISMPIGA